MPNFSQEIKGLVVKKLVIVGEQKLERDITNRIARDLVLCYDAR